MQACKSISLYECPYCKLTSKRRYNVNKHINRKHPRSEIPSNLLSDSYQDTNSEYLRHRTEYTEKYLNQFKPYLQPILILG